MDQFKFPGISMPFDKETSLSAQPHIPIVVFHDLPDRTVFKDFGMSERNFFSSILTL
jgi:hypothetical protein